MSRVFFPFTTLMAILILLVVPVISLTNSLSFLHTIAAPPIEIKNDYLKITGSGYISISTVDGRPLTIPSFVLLAGTAWLRVNGVRTYELRHTEIVEANGTSIVATWNSSSYIARQKLYFAEEETTRQPRNAVIEYTIINTSSTSINIEMKLYIPAVAAGNGPSDYVVDGDGKITKERVWSGESIPQYWRVFGGEADEVLPQSSETVGQLTGSVATPPDKFMIINGDLDNCGERDRGRWDYPIDTNCGLSVPTALIYFKSATLGPNESYTYRTLYGMPSDVTPPLAQKFAPIMYFHQDDIYRPIHPRSIMPLVSFMSDGGTFSPKTITPVTLETMAEPEWRTNTKAYIDMIGSGPFAAEAFYELTIKTGEYPLVFSRVYSNTEDIAVQYWFYYYDNNWKNHHESDWEMVQVVLDKNEIPLYAAYSQHKDWGPDGDIVIPYEGGSKRLWDYVEKQGDRPIVYVARGSHASFFKPYTYTYDLPGFGSWNGVDTTTPKVGPIDPIVQPLPLSENMDTWTYYEGAWGDVPLGCSRNASCGPPGPYRTASEWNHQWDDPIMWANHIPWDESKSASLNWGRAIFEVDNTFDIGVIHLPTGKRVDAFVNQIPDSEYIDNLDSKKRTIILYNEARFGTEYRRYRWRVRNNRAVAIRDNQQNSGDGFTLNNETGIKVGFTMPNFTAGKTISVEYTLPSNWQATSAAEVLIEPGADLKLQVDLDGNGIVDQQVDPVIEERLIDFTAPAPITDLTASKSINGKVSLSWTAPGDDGATGSASRYEIRYSAKPITYTNWSSAWSVTQPITPSVAGATETPHLETLEQEGLIYFAIKVFDDMLWDSGLSNVVSIEVPKGTYIRQLYLPLVNR